MRRLFILALLSANLLLAQEGDYYPDQLYVQVAQSHPQLLLPTGENGDSLMALLPENLQLALMPGGLKGISKFGILKDEAIQRIYKVYFINTTKLDVVLAALQSLSNIEMAEKVPIMWPLGTVNDPLYSSQWYHDKINMQSAWDLSTGSGVKIGIVDDGVMVFHDDLAGQCLPGYDVADNDNDPSPPATATDFFFSHGTHCAGISAASGNNNTGGAGIAYNAIIIPIKAKKDTSTSRAIEFAWEGVQRAANEGADILSLSWGNNNFSTVNRNLINTITSQGVIVVAAAGNDNSEALHYPAAYDNVVAVGASDIFDKRAGFSNYGSWVDIMAPGQTINSTVATSISSYRVYDGTSMSAPLIAGVLALGKAYSPQSSSAELLNCLYSTAVDMDANNPGFGGKLGAGRVDAQAFLQCLSPGCSALTSLSNQSGSFTDGSVQSEPYLPNANCGWLIQPADATSITLDFSAFNLEDGQDFLSVYDGIDENAPLLATLTGQAVPGDITSTSGAIFLRFTSDASGDSTGFSVDYTAQFYKCSGQVVMDASAGTFTDSPVNYGNFSNCSWLIQPQGASFVTLSVTALATEANNDALKVYDGTDQNAALLADLSGSPTVPQSFTSSSGSMFITFKSDASITDEGFVADYTSNGTLVGVSYPKRNQLRLFPNPVQDIATLQYPGAATVEAYNSLGQRLLRSPHQDISTIDLSEYTSGLYFIHVLPKGQSPQMLKVFVE